MPSNQRIRLHDREKATPVNEPRQRDECNPRRVVGTARLHLPLHVQSQLLSQEQILGGEFRRRLSGREDQSQEITANALEGSKRDAPARLSHGLRIVRDALVQQRPSHKL